MIVHFLKRDVRDNTAAWALLLGVTGVGGLVSWTIAGTYGWLVLFYAYFLFAITLSASTVGSVWRTQYGLSRYYLLALPIAHRRLFVFQQARMLLPWMPLLMLGGLSPWLGAVPSPWTARGWSLYYLGLVVSVGLEIQCGLWATLEHERIAAYLPKGARFWTHVKILLVFLGVWIALMEAWMELFGARFGPLLRVFDLPPLQANVVFPGGLVVLAVWLRHNARRWCVTL